MKFPVILQLMASPSGDVLSWRSAHPMNHFMTLQGDVYSEVRVKSKCLDNNPVVVRLLRRPDGSVKFCTKHKAWVAYIMNGKFHGDPEAWN